jgi:hypothetical protein
MELTLSTLAELSQGTKGYSNCNGYLRPSYDYQNLTSYKPLLVLGRLFTKFSFDKIGIYAYQKMVVPSSFNKTCHKIKDF